LIIEKLHLIFRLPSFKEHGIKSNVFQTCSTQTQNAFKTNSFWTAFRRRSTRPLFKSISFLFKILCYYDYDDKSSFLYFIRSSNQYKTLMFTMQLNAFNSNASDASKLKFTMDFVPLWFQYIPWLRSTVLDFWILDTDYETFALFYGCNEIQGIHFSRSVQNGGILSRTRTLPDEKRNELKEILDKNGIDSNLLVEIDHRDCWTNWAFWKIKSSRFCLIWIKNKTGKTRFSNSVGINF
jgi:hypothetical protein